VLTDIKNVTLRQEKFRYVKKFEEYLDGCVLTKDGNLVAIYGDFKDKERA
jgi:hypothetical protein